MARGLDVLIPGSRIQFAMTSLNKLQLKNVDVKGKRVFIRVDFNVPQDKKDPSVPLLQSPSPCMLAQHALPGRAPGSRPRGEVLSLLALARVTIEISDCTGQFAKLIATSPSRLRITKRTN